MNCVFYGKNQALTLFFSRKITHCVYVRFIPFDYCEGSCDHLTPYGIDNRHLILSLLHLPFVILRHLHIKTFSVYGG